MIDWESPRGRGVKAVEQAAPMVANHWNAQVELAWSGDEITEIKHTAQDGTIVSWSITWAGGELARIDRAAEA